MDQHRTVMKKFILIAGLSVTMTGPGHAQFGKPSGPLAWVSSDVNPDTVFWIQGRFVAVNGPSDENGAEVTTILCSVREHECLVMTSTTAFSGNEQTWIDDFKPVSWDKDGIVALSHSLDGCTDETLKVHFSSPSALVINSPVLPMSGNCTKFNSALDKLMGEKGTTLKEQTEEYMLVPTRGLVPFQDLNPNSGKPSAPPAK